MHCFYQGNRQQGTEHPRNHTKGLTSRDSTQLTGDKQEIDVESSGQAGTESVSRPPQKASLAASITFALGKLALNTLPT